MKIFELLSEQTIGTVGSSGGPTPTVGTVSNVPSDKPGSATSQDPNKADPNKTDPNMQKLAATLKQNKVIDNEKDINNFLGAYQAQQTGKTLNPDQQASLASLATAMLKNRNLATNLDLQLKATAQQKPGTSPVQKAPGGM